MPRGEVKISRPILGFKHRHQPHLLSCLIDAALYVFVFGDTCISHPVTLCPVFSMSCVCFSVA